MVSQIIKQQILEMKYAEKKFFWTLFSILVFTIVLYGFLLNRAMMNAVSKQNMEKESVSLESDVNSLEFQYLNAKNNITTELAQSKGFVLVSSDKFALIDSAQKNLSLSINEN